MDTFLSFLPFFLASVAAALPGVLIRPGDWYRGLAKPPWRPPDWLFGPVWTVLYISIAVAAWRVWQTAGFDGATLALSVYAVQLGFNAMWSVIFFGLRQPGWAFAEIICLWLSVLATIAVFYPVDAVAGLILIPYALWVSFAVALNYRIWRLNPA